MKMRINDKENYNRVKDSISMNNLRSIIKEKGFSQVKVAYNAKITVSTLGAYMSGNKIPSLPTLINLADYLKVNIDYLLDRTNNPEIIKNLNDDEDSDLANMFSIISSLNSHERELVMAYIKGLLSNK